MDRLSSSTSSSDAGRGSLRDAVSVLVWTVVVLACIDVAVGALTTYPDEPVGSEISRTQRYFNYGRSIESKLRWMVGDTDEESAPLVRAGWPIREQDRKSTADPGREHLVSFYGMSFSAHVAEALERADDTVTVRVSGGPAAPLSHSFAEFRDDRDRHDADVVVLGALASSLPGLSSATHMTWHFEAPSPHFYPRFFVQDGELREWPPPARSLAEFREIMHDPGRWQAMVEHLRGHDSFYDPFAFEANCLDSSVVMRALRRAWAVGVYQREIARHHDSDGFTDHLGSVTTASRIVQAFAEAARADGRLPVVLLFNNRGYSDHLYRALRATLEAHDIPYLSTHEFAPAEDLGNFLPDGHFVAEVDAEMAARLSALIHRELGPGGGK